MDIIGVNETTSSTNAAMYLGRSLSWLRDTAAAGAQSKLNGTYRDVVVLDPLNNRLFVYNLTVNDLTIPANRQALRNLLIAAATPVDEDGDQLPDYWERSLFGDLTRGPNTIMPDGRRLLLHFMLGTANPAAPTPAALPSLNLVDDGLGQRRLLHQFRRRRGNVGGITLVPQVSDDLTSWTAPAAGWSLLRTTRLYDGSGCDFVEWWTTGPPAPGIPRWTRVRAALP